MKFLINTQFFFRVKLFQQLTVLRWYEKLGVGVKRVCELSFLAR